MNYPCKNCQECWDKAYLVFKSCENKSSSKCWAAILNDKFGGPTYSKEEGWESSPDLKR